MTTRQKRPDKCIHCDRPLRPGGTRKDDYPGTVAYNAKGSCVACYHKGKAVAIGQGGPGAARKEWPRSCAECDRAMRSSKGSAEDYPGTAVHAAQGVCHVCYQRAYRAAKRRPAA